MLHGSVVVLGCKWHKGGAQRIFFRYYSSVDDHEQSALWQEEYLTVRHLVWEQQAASKKQKAGSPHHANVHMGATRECVCTCPHFKEQDDSRHSLLNDLTDWWLLADLVRVSFTPVNSAVLSDTADEYSEPKLDDNV